MTLTEEQIAEACHEANRACCQATGDYTHSPWSLSRPELKASVVDGVRFHVKNPGSTPESSHENWLKFKEAEGWTYGPVKDFDKKTHPCFMPYHQLPLEQRVKDELFIAIVETLKKF